MVSRRPCAGTSGTGVLERSRPSATTGKISTDSSPAVTIAAPVTGEIRPSSIPIWMAATMNGSDVACSSATASGRPAAERPQLEQRGRPRITSSASRKTGTRSSADGLVEQPLQVEPDAAAHEEHGDQEAEPDRLELGPEVRVAGGVAVDHADDDAGEEGAEDALQADPLGQRGERDQQHHGEAHPDLGGRVLQPEQHLAEAHRRGRRGRRRVPVTATSRTNSAEQRQPAAGAAVGRREQQRQQHDRREVGDRRGEDRALTDLGCRTARRP